MVNYKYVSWINDQISKRMPLDYTLKKERENFTVAVKH